MRTRDAVRRHAAALFAVAFGCALSALGEGSKEMCANGGNRPRLEFRNDTTSNIQRRTTIKVYVKVGETLYLGSSAQGVQSTATPYVYGTINIRKPNNATATSGTGTSPGRIESRAQEVAGPAPNPGGYTPWIVPVDQEGVWEIDFVSPDQRLTSPDPGLLDAGADWETLQPQDGNDMFVLAWDVTVRNNITHATILGRAYANCLALMMGANDGSLNSILWVVTKDGYRYKVYFNGLDPFGFICHATNRGVKDAATGDPAYQSKAFPLNVPADLFDPHNPDTWGEITHKLFFNPPAADLPSAALAPSGSGGETWLIREPIGPPTPTSFQFLGLESTPNNGGTWPLGGYFTFNVDRLATYTIVLDLDNDANYGPLPDRILNGVAMPGANQVYWDGLDGNGDAVPASTQNYNAIVRCNMGEVHFPILDPENNPVGIKLERLNNPSPPPVPLPDVWTVYFDDSPLTPSYAGNYALNGVSSASGAHSWPDDFGNVKGMETWANFPGSEIEITTLLTVREADLSVTKTHAPTNVFRGQTFTWTVVVHNGGPDNVTGAQFLDTIPTGVTVSSWTSSVTGTGSTTPSSGGSITSLDCQVNLTNGSSITYTFNGTLKATATGFGDVTNVAKILRPVDVTDPNDPYRTGAGNNTATDTLPAADLRLTMITSDPQPSKTESFYYTLTLTNYGPNTATSVQVNDDLPAGITFVSSVPSQGTYNSSTGIWNVGTLASGASVTLRLNVANTSTAAKTNWAEVVQSDQWDPTSTPNNYATAPTEDDGAVVIIRGGEVDLSLTKTANTTNPLLGGQVIFTITVTNANHQDNATNVVVRDVLPAGMTFVSASTTTYNSLTGAWNVGTLNENTSKTLQITATVNTPGAKTNTAQVSKCDQPDVDSVPNNNIPPPTEDDQDSETVTPQQIDLSVTQTASDLLPNQDSNVTLTIVLANGGPDAATGVVVKDLLPAGMTFVSYTASAGTYVSGTGLWTIPGSVASGATRTLTITATMTATGTFTSTAEVTAANQYDPDSTPNNHIAYEDDQDSVTLKCGPPWHPTPVTLDSFTASGELTGVLLQWRCLSELNNAGFHVYARPAGSGGAWQRLNPALIPGRITAAAPKTYAYFHVTTGWHEYKLVSESTVGALAAERRAGPAGPAAGGTPQGKTALAETLKTGAAQARYAKLGQQAGGAGNVPIVTVQEVASAQNLGKATPAGTRAAFLGGLQDVGAKLQAGGAGATTGYEPRATSLEPRAVEVPTGTVAKVVTGGRGVLWLPQSALPAGFDIRKLRILREGKAVSALALLTTGLALWAPGYADDYTDKDAFFLQKSTLSTSAGKQTTLRGLFTSTRQPVRVQTAVASQDFHDVYYDWSSSMRPWNYPPWFSNKYLSGGTAQTFALTTALLAPGSGVLRLRLWSLSDLADEAPDHSLQAFANGQLVGTVNWDGGGKMLEFAFYVPAGVLVQGVNTFEFRTPALASGARVLSLVHELALEYPQQLRASAPLEAWLPGQNSGLAEVSGLPSATAWVVNLTDATKPALLGYETRRETNGTYTLRFQCLSTGGGRYMVTPQGKEMSPLAVKSRALKLPTAVWSYLATGPAQFKDSVAPLLAARTAEGLSGTFMDQEDFFDLYAYGRYGPAGIRGAVRALRPRFLLLVGRTHFDYRNYQGLGMDPQCPTYLTDTSYFGQTGGDPWYGDLGGGYPEVAVGRLPLRTPGEVSVAVKRILSYRGGGESGYQGVLLADTPDPAAGDFHLEADRLALDVSDVNWTKVYLGDAPIDTPAAARAAAVAEVNAGASVLLFNGHGSSSRMGMERIIGNTDDNSDWTGNAVLLIASCNGNYHTNNDPSYYSLVEKLLAQPGGGISASIASATYLDSPPHMDFMEQLVLNSRLAGRRWGEALVATQRWSYERSRTSGADPNYADMARSECLMGDPALPVQAPSAATRAAPPPPPRDDF